MITAESISKFYEDVKALGLKFPVAAISKKTGYSKGNVSQYLTGKDDPSENFLKSFYREFGDSFKNVSRAAADVGTAAKSVAKGGSDDLMRVLANLSESHRSLAAAHKEIAQSNNHLSLANNTLAENEKMILQRMPTADDAEGNDINDPSILVPLVEILAGIASGKVRYQTKGEALAELGRQLSLHKPAKVKLKRSGADGHR